MEASRVFLKVRAVAFSCIGITSLIWVILLCVEAFYRWDESPTSERAMVVLQLLANAITVILLLILVLLPFRLWLDAARLLFLFILHGGLAVAYTYINMRLECPKRTSDDNRVCKLVNMCMLLASWVIPGFLLAYTSWLLFAIYRHWQITSQKSMDHDNEAGFIRQSTPVMQPARSPRASSFFRTEPNRVSGRISSNSGHDISFDNDVGVYGNRLSKQRPMVFWTLISSIETIWRVLILYFLFFSMYFTAA